MPTTTGGADTVQVTIQNDTPHEVTVYIDDVQVDVVQPQGLSLVTVTKGQHDFRVSVPPAANVIDGGASPFLSINVIMRVYIIPDGPGGADRLVTSLAAAP